MHVLLLTFTLTAIQSATAPALPPPEIKPHAAPTKLTPPSRSDLARAYLRFEEAFALHPMSGEPLRELNRAFDRATVSFFLGNRGEALRTIDDATYSLVQGDALAPDRTLMSLVARFDPPTASVVRNTTALRATIEPLYLIPSDASRPRPLRLSLVSPFESGMELARLDVTDWRPDGPPVEFRVSIPELAPESYALVAGIHEEAVPTSIARWDATLEDVATQRTSNEARAAKLAPVGPPMEAALAAFRSRNAVLARWDAPERTAFLQWTREELLRELVTELKALEEGRDPYRRRAGDLWRTVRVGKDGLPVRIFAPPAACTDTRVPLVIALHGAGGDENMFFDGLGAGKIVELAKARGFVVAAPLLGFAGLSGEAFDVLVGELAFDYAIDPDRIHVVGHSMGAGAACGLAARRRERIASVACFAGGSAPKDGAMAPTRIWAGELDPLAKPEGLVKLAEKARALSAPVECTVVPDYGHTLVVGARLGEALDWLLGHRLGARTEESVPKK